MLEFHYTYLIMALSLSLTGYYLNLIVFTSLVLVHEFGHFLVAKILKFNVSKIIIYPYGGITKISDLINKKINNELLIAISGIITEIIFYNIIVILYKNNIIREYTMNLFTLYNSQIILFNILPIYPLDGSKILNLLLCKFFDYDTSNKLTILVSIVLIIILIIYNINNTNYSSLMTITILITYIYKFTKNLKYLYKRFLLERYIYNIKYNNIKIINKNKKLFKDYTHIIKDKDKYIKENSYLKEIFHK